MNRILLSGVLLAAGVLTGCKAGQADVALGTLERDRVVLTATASEVIAEVAVHEGEHLMEGQVLLRLDPRRQQTRVSLAEAGVQQSQAHLAELRNGVREEEIAAAKARLEGARAALTAASNQLERVRALFDQRLVGKADYDAAVAQRDSARATVKDAEERWRLLLAGTRIEQLQQAEAQLAAAQASLALEQQALDELSVSASRAGIVDSLPWKRGDRVTAGALLAVLLTGDTPYARVYLPQRLRATLHEGDPVQVQVDGVAGTFTGRVRALSSEPAFTPFYALNQKERTHLVYLTEIQLPQDAANLPAGLTAQALLPEVGGSHE